ncbi:MAG: hypothetical protein IJS00_02325 [Paludibacteraceae bacterium]|nr:hypothetical protein [Paludibacteraceae bacterium]
MKKRLIILLTIGLYGICFGAMAQTIKPYPIDTVNSVICYRYTPEKSIGLFRISKRFDVSQESIKALNPQLKDRGPQLDEVIYIPLTPEALSELNKQTMLSKAEEQKKAVADKPQPKQEIKKEIRQEQQKEIKQEQQQELEHRQTLSSDFIRSLFGNDSLKSVRDTSGCLSLAVILPFHADADKRDLSDDRFVDFYMGLLLAVKSYADAGQPLQIHTYDVERTDTLLGKVLSDPFLKQADAIIGPAYPAQVNTMARFAQKNKIWILVPFTSNVPSIDTNPYLLQFNPTAEMEAEAMATYLTRRENALQCVFIEPENNKITDGVAQMRERIADKQIPIAQTTINAILTDSLEDVLKDSVENIFLFNTDRYGALRVLMPHLVNANQKYLITLMSQYSWQKENIPLGQVYTSIFSSEFYSANDSISYAADWQRYCHYRPSSDWPRFDLLGYDLTCHLLRMLQQMQEVVDPNYIPTILTRPYNGLQSRIQYRRVSYTGGYINCSLQVLTR